MKINEKFLTLYANSPEHVDKEGYIYKKGELNKGFQVRWFVLKGNLLFYFEKQNDKQPIGLIILDECNVEACEGEGCSFSISFHSEKGAGRSYILSAKDEREMESWMKILTIASYSYTSMLVNELERTLNNLRAEENALGMSTLTLSPERSANRPKSDDSSQADVSRPPNRYSNNPSLSVVPPSLKSIDISSIASSMKATQKIRNSLPAFKRSKSQENMHKLDKKFDSKSPLNKRKQKNQQNTVLSSSSNTKFISTVIPSDGNLLEINHVYETGPTTFEDLHDLYGGTIWTTVREFENKSDSTEIVLSD